MTPLAVAHHSYAGFDRTRSRTLEGEVLKLDWRNPHVHFWIAVPNAASPTGRDVWTFEAGGINLVTKFGWSLNTFRIGEKVKVTFFPMEDGRHGGAFIKAQHADGSWTTGDLDGANYFSR
jgi:hypothetical protein